MTATNVNFGFSHLKQSNYATALANSAVFKRCITTDESPFDMDSAWENNQGWANGGNEMSDMWKTTNDTKKSFPVNLCFQEIGYWLHGVMGEVTPSTVSGAGNSAVRNHAFACLDLNASLQLPTRTALQEYPNLKKYLIPSMLVKKLTLTRSNKAGGYLTASAETIGSGAYVINPSGYTMPALPQGQTFAWSNQSSLEFVEVQNDDSQIYTCPIEDWSLMIENETKDAEGFRSCSPNLISGDPTSGLVRAELLTIRKKVELDFTVRLEASDKLQGFFRLGQTLNFNVEILGQAVGATTYRIYASALAAKITQYKESKDGEFIVIKGKAEAMNTSGTGSLNFTVDLRNDVLSYLS
jgi:hypothetical protein